MTQNTRFTRMKICPIFLELTRNTETFEDFLSLRSMKISDFPEKKKKSFLLTNMEKGARGIVSGPQVLRRERTYTNGFASHPGG